MKIVALADLEAALVRCKAAQPADGLYSAEMRILCQIRDQLLSSRTHSLVLQRQPVVHQMVLQRWLPMGAEAVSGDCRRELGK